MGVKFSKSSGWCRLRLQVAAILFLSVQIVAQSGTAKTVAEIVLNPLGVRVPPRGTSSATRMELLFVSDTYMVLLIEKDPLHEPSHLILYEIGEGGVRAAKTLSLGEAVLPISSSPAVPVKVLEWVDSEHFAYWTYLGEGHRWLCDMEVNCREDKQGVTPITLPHAANCGLQDLLGFIDAERAVCLAPRAHKSRSPAIVIDSSGHRLYEVERAALPWDARLVSSVQGQRFGLEWKLNTALQRLSLACIDDCPPAGSQHFVIFNTSDGREVQSFNWDPRPYNLDVLPALSPSGKTAAFVRADRLAIYSLDYRH
jgi:hypothetical protein